MAIVYAYYGFNVQNTNLYWYAQNYYSDQLWDNSFYNGFLGGPYEDLYQIAGSTLTDARYLNVGGSGMAQSFDGTIFTGTANYMSENFYTGATIWEAYGFNLSAAAIYEAGLTSSNEDDINLIALALSGNDFISLSQYDDRMSGYNGNDNIIGNGGNDFLVGADGNDKLNGGFGNDTLIGGENKDTLKGGGNSDSFVFLAAGDSGIARNKDVITDFKKIDFIDLSAIDANSRQGGDQAFDYIGGASFSGSGGEVRFKNGVLSADIDGNRLPDFQIGLKDVTSLSANDIFL